jgi:uncharacterized protein YxeA
MMVYIMIITLAGCGHNRTRTGQDWSPDIRKLEGEVKSVKIALYREEQLVQTLISSYDRRGNKTETLIYDAEGALVQVYRYVHDSRDQLLVRSSFHPNGHQIQKDIYRYDRKGNLIENERHNFSLQQHTTFYVEYDKKGREQKVSRHAADGKILSVRSFSYDRQGNKDELIEDAELGTLSYRQAVFDARGNEIESREHDAAGNILVRSVTTYDDHDQVIGHISYRADGSVIRRKSYEYQYDLKQNWIKKTEYQDSLPLSVSLREIEYD